VHGFVKIIHSKIWIWEKESSNLLVIVPWWS